MTFNTENYQLKCKDTIDHFIKNATRLEKFAFNLEAIETFSLDYQIILNIHLSFRTENERHLGSPTSSPDHIVYDNKNAYTNALEALIEQETSAPGNLSFIKNKVLEQPFGVLHTTTDLKTCSERFSYCHECDECHGEGETKCASCSGTGLSTCNYCKGYGFVQETKTIDVNYGPKELQGFRTESVNVTCHYCNGQGQNRCDNCLGRGETTCTKCDGKRYITDTTTVIITAVPQYTPRFYREDIPDFIEEAFDHYGLYRLDKVGAVTYTDYQHIDASTLRFQYEANCPFARFKSIIHNNDIYWILFGESPILFESSNVIEILLKQDLYELESSAATSHLLKPRIFSSCQPAVQKFTESEINQELIQLTNSNPNFEKIRNQLNRSVSVNYVEKVHHSLDQISKAISYWSALKWTLAIFLIIILYSNAAVLFNMLPYEFDRLAKYSATSVPSFYEDIYRPDGTLLLWKAIGKLASHLLIPILTISFLCSLFRVYWLKMKINEKMPYLYIWMEKRDTLPIKWVQMGIITSIISCILIDYVKLPIYYGNLLGILPIHWFL